MLKCNEENGVEGHLSLECIGGEGYIQQVHKNKPIWNLVQYFALSEYLWWTAIISQKFSDWPDLPNILLLSNRKVCINIFKKYIFMKVESMIINAIYELCPWQINHEAWEHMNANGYYCNAICSRISSPAILSIRARAQLSACNVHARPRPR